jgi:hypothetical protein
LVVKALNGKSARPITSVAVSVNVIVAPDVGGTSVASARRLYCEPSWFTAKAESIVIVGGVSSKHLCALSSTFRVYPSAQLPTNTLSLSVVHVRLAVSTALATGVHKVQAPWSTNQPSAHASVTLSLSVVHVRLAVSA